MIIPKALIALAIVCLLSGIFLGGCSRSTPTPEPRVVTVEVPRIVQQKCKDQRPPSDTYPDSDAALAMIDATDFERLGRVFRAGRDLRDARLLIDDVQIKACAE